MAKANDLYVDVAAGQYLFREGDAGAEMYIIESGRIAILRAARGSEPLALLEPGDFLGEMAILEDQPRFASALAQADTRLLRIERGAFAELLRQNVEIAIRIMRKLVLRQRRTELRVNELQKALQQLRDPAGQAAVAPGAAGQAAVERAAAGSAPAPAAVPVAPVVVPAPADSAAVARPSAAAQAPAFAGAPVPAPPSAPPAVAPTPPAPSPPAAAPPVAAPAPAARESAGLALLHAATGERFVLEPGRSEFLVGRIDPVTGITPEINLGPLDTARSLSRRHAKLLRQGALLFLREEVGTANGTFLNGQRLATGAAVGVKPGDRLRFGTIEIELIAL
ncbi:cyclic nucleotide-binding domain-containing protein [Tahibacter harae]|uniref:Cyclic nucleotide-binding domain-containing protein n=1 Tax=Tahibacter harae TaxID=2963937 RepID=A0ABT1QPF1_9GAMM|nr:cyclic nucleotide-binding domain-containing protein [Tahibacter harae]MCQ4164164.1 cyclic nucleotide-binding domain-containing protein [Tahibacter harae]